MAYSGTKIYQWYKDTINNKEIAEQIKDTVKVEENKKDYTVDFNRLKE